MTTLSLPFLLRTLARENDWETIPPREGGRLFRTISDLTGVPLPQVTDCARREGLWPHTAGSHAFAAPINREAGRAAYDRLADSLCDALATPAGRATLEEGQ